MKEVRIEATYLRVEALLDLISEPARSGVKALFRENEALFKSARGSTHNHQAWEGGYIDHITECMNYAKALYALDNALRPAPFALSDALLILFLHDLEKPWRIMVAESGEASNREGLSTKAQFKAFREEKLRERGIILDEPQMNALTYVEGEMGDYSSKRRVMNELAAFCHKVDVWSARQCHDCPKEANDPWEGAARFR